MTMITHTMRKRKVTSALLCPLRIMAICRDASEQLVIILNPTTR